MVKIGERELGVILHYLYSSFNILKLFISFLIKAID